MASNNVPLLAPPVFIGKNDEMWVVKMRRQLKAFDLWKAMETTEPPALEENPTVAQIKFHSKQVAKRAKALTILHSVVDDDVFMRISNLDTAREIWEKLQEEFFGNERTKKM
ncbi:hypothetical protein JHK84_035672 [Glycine max]|nr:hypothetical protein JHK84_035672 [Glycine max]